MAKRDSDHKAPYAKPELVKQDNVKDVTLECPNWQCSVVVPPPPQA